MLTRSVRRKHIRSLVDYILKNQGIVAAPIDVEKIASILGINVQYEPAEENLSGFLLRDLSRHTAVIGINSNHHINRQRFTIAHELGHFHLHEGEKIHVDRLAFDRGFQVKNLRDGEASKGISVEEKEANLFAAELLMPTEFLKQDIAEVDLLDLFDEDGLKSLAEKYKVSTQALTFRLAYLDYIQL
jgi:Zn-dependent peptidase ImmA (M78 family)